MNTAAPAGQFLLASDFDRMLSFNDSGLLLSEVIGVEDFERKVPGLAHSNLVQQGGELAYLIRHDPAFRGVRREHLEEAGRRVRLKRDYGLSLQEWDHSHTDRMTVREADQPAGDVSLSPSC